MYMIIEGYTAHCLTVWSACHIQCFVLDPEGGDIKCHW